MAAFGILAACARVRASSSTSRWRTARCRCWRCRPRNCSRAARPPRRGELVLGGRLLCYRPYPCADGWVSMGALEPKFWAAFCRGVGRPDLVEHQFERPAPRLTLRSRPSSPAAPAPSGRRSTPSTTAASSRCSSSTRRWRTNTCAPAGMVAGALLGNPIPDAATRGDARPWRAHSAVLAAAGLARGDARCERAHDELLRGALGGRPRTARPSARAGRGIRAISTPGRRRRC